MHNGTEKKEPPAKCPKGHTLTPHAMKHATDTNCKKCEGKIHAGDVLRVCWKCEYVVCPRCVAEKNIWNGAPLHKEGCEDVTFSFQPGFLGLVTDDPTGRVDEVFHSSQAGTFGVQAGWSIIKVDGKAYSPSALESCLGGDSEYSVTFRIKVEGVQHTNSMMASTQSSRNETNERKSRGTRLLNGAANVASKMMQSMKRKSSREGTSSVGVDSFDVKSVVPSGPVGTPNKGEQKNRKSLFRRGRDFVGTLSRSRKKGATNATKIVEDEDLETRVRGFSVTGSDSSIDMSKDRPGIATKAVVKTKIAVHAPMPGALIPGELTVLADDEEIVQRIREEEAQMLRAHGSSSNNPTSAPHPIREERVKSHHTNHNPFAKNLDSAPHPVHEESVKSHHVHHNPFAKNLEADKHKQMHHPKSAVASREASWTTTLSKKKEDWHEAHYMVDDRAEDWWTCWHVTSIDVIINFQLYELLQKKWRCKAHELVEERKQSEAEIIDYMIHNRRFAKEEREGDAKHTVGYKTKMITKFMERVYTNVERCVLVEQDYMAFLEITFGRLVDFDPKEHFGFLKHHKELSKDLHSLMKPSTDDSDDDLLYELRKPLMREYDSNQLKEVFSQLDDRRVGAVSIGKLKTHDDFCVADFQSFEFMEEVKFDVFLALVCPSTHRTMSTVWEIILKKMRSRLEQLHNARSRDMSLAEALASLEDELLPTMPPQLEKIYKEVYDQLDWNSTSCVVMWIKMGIKSLIEEPGAIGFGLHLENSQRLSFAEFSGFVRLDAYKRFRKTPELTPHRQALTGLEVSQQQLADLPSRPVKRAFF